MMNHVNIIEIVFLVTTTELKSFYFSINHGLQRVVFFLQF